MVVWFDRVLLDLTRGDRRRGPGRYSRRRSGNQYHLVELTSARDLLVEGEAMNHCVATYASAVAQRQCRIYSVRRGNRRIATLELRWPHAKSRPVINQLLGHSNVAVDREVYLAVSDWLAHNLPSGVCTDNGWIWRAPWTRRAGAPSGAATLPKRAMMRSCLKDRTASSSQGLCRDIDTLHRWLHA